MLDQCHAGDLALGAKVAAGKLRGDSVVHGLVASFLQMYREDLQERRYQTTSAFLRFASVQEALVDLGQSQEVKSLLARFCVNTNLFTALETPEKLSKSIRAAFGHLKLRDRPSLLNLRRDSRRSQLRAHDRRCSGRRRHHRGRSVVETCSRQLFCLEPGGVLPVQPSTGQGLSPVPLVSRENEQTQTNMPSTSV